jgi:hypothetical protein
MSVGIAGVCDNALYAYVVTPNDTPMKKYRFFSKICKKNLSFQKFKKTCVFVRS